MSDYVRPGLNESPMADRGSSLLAVVRFGLGARVGQRRGSIERFDASGLRRDPRFGPRCWFSNLVSEAVARFSEGA
jgi:hypothetical protein